MKGHSSFRNLMPGERLSIWSRHALAPGLGSMRSEEGIARAWKSPQRQLILAAGHLFSCIFNSVEMAVEKTHATESKECDQVDAVAATMTFDVCQHSLIGRLFVCAPRFPLPLSSPFRFCRLVCQPHIGTSHVRHCVLWCTSRFSSI